MADATLTAQIEAANGYDSLLVPAMFAQWPPLLVDAADLGPGARVLDVACGTGILTREAARRVGASGTVVGLDPGAGMLEVARRNAPEIEWREGVAEKLPFDDANFDAVVSQFGFMFFSDKAAAATEMLRVLRPGGRIAVAVWDALENIPAYAAEVELIERLAGRAAADCVRAPFALGDAGDFARQFPDAAGPTVTTHTATGRFPSVNAMLDADLRGWLPILGIELEEPLIQSILAEAQQIFAPYVQPDGRVQLDISAHILAATKPH